MELCETPVVVKFAYRSRGSKPSCSSKAASPPWAALKSNVMAARIRGQGKAGRGEEKGSTMMEKGGARLNMRIGLWCAFCGAESGHRSFTGISRAHTRETRELRGCQGRLIDRMQTRPTWDEGRTIKAGLSARAMQGDKLERPEDVEMSTGVGGGRRRSCWMPLSVGGVCRQVTRDAGPPQ